MLNLLMPILIITSTPEQQIVDYLFDKMDTQYIQNKYPERLKKSLAIIPVIIDESKKDPQIDPFLIAQLIYWESRWDSKAKGKLNEIGLMQLHGKAKGDSDLTNPENQIRAGVNWLRKSLLKCGTIEAAINAYGTGKCKPILNFAKIRIKKYHKQKNKYSSRLILEPRWLYYVSIVRRNY